MGKKKKIIFAVAISLFVIAAVVLLILLVPRKEELDGYDQYAAQLKNGFEADIMLYGEPFTFRETVDYRRIEAIDEQQLTARQSDYHAIVLMDLYGEMQITDEELLLIKAFVEEKGYDMLYIGKAKLDDFVRLGLTARCPEDDCCLMYIGSNKVGMKVQQDEVGNLYAEHGMWKDADMQYITENTEELESTLVWFICMYACDAFGVDKVTFQ